MNYRTYTVSGLSDTNGNGVYTWADDSQKWYNSNYYVLAPAGGTLPNSTITDSSYNVIATSTGGNATYYTPSTRGWGSVSVTKTLGDLVYVVSSSGQTNTNGTYDRLSASTVEYTLNTPMINANGQTIFGFVSGDLWYMIDNTGYSSYLYSGGSNSANASDGAWTENTGASPAPTVALYVAPPKVAKPLVVLNGVIKNLPSDYFLTHLHSYTVATLPASAQSVQGMEAIVTDALAPTYGSTVVAGGAVVAKVWYDGSNWIVG